MRYIRARSPSPTGTGSDLGNRPFHCFLLANLAKRNDAALLAPLDVRYVETLLKNATPKLPDESSFQNVLSYPVSRPHWTDLATGIGTTALPDAASPLVTYPSVVTENPTGRSAIRRTNTFGSTDAAIADPQTSADMMSVVTVSRRTA